MPSKWIDHVKSYAKQHNKKYGECMGDAQCKKEYHESKGAGMEGGKFHLGKSLKKLNTKIKDVAVSKAAGQYLNTVKKSGQIVKTGLNFVKKSGIAEYVPYGEEMVDTGIQGIKYQNRGINILQDKRQNLIDKREERQQRQQLNGGSFKSFDGGSFSMRGGAINDVNDKYDAVYGNTNGLSKYHQSFYPNTHDTKSMREQMFGVR